MVSFHILGFIFSLLLLNDFVLLQEYIAVNHITIIYSCVLPEGQLLDIYLYSVANVYLVKLGNCLGVPNLVRWPQSMRQNDTHWGHHHQSDMPKGRSFTANSGTKGRSSAANSGIKVAVLLGMNRCSNFPLLSAPHSLFSIWTDFKRSEKIPGALTWKWWEWIWLTGPLDYIEIHHRVKYQFHEGFLTRSEISITLHPHIYIYWKFKAVSSEGSWDTEVLRIKRYPILSYFPLQVQNFVFLRLNSTVKEDLSFLSAPP